MFDRNQAQSGFSRLMVVREWLSHLAGEINAGLKVLTRVQYDRPWQRVDPARIQRTDRG